jgi:hypothetical protein
VREYGKRIREGGQKEDKGGSTERGSGREDGKRIREEGWKEDKGGRTDNEDTGRKGGRTDNEDTDQRNHGGQGRG